MTQDIQTNDTVPVEDLDTFVKLLTEWHNNRKAVLGHMLTIPEGTEVSVNDGELHVLEGDLLKGFHIGVTTALIELGTLPFAVEFDEASAVEPVDA